MLRESLSTALIVGYLTDHPQSDTTQIAAGLGWPVAKVSQAIIAEFRRPPPHPIVRTKDWSRGRYVYARTGDASPEPVTQAPAPVIRPPEEKTAEPIKQDPEDLKDVLATGPGHVMLLPDSDTLTGVVETLALSIARHLAVRVNHHLLRELSESVPATLPPSPEPLTTVEELIARVKTPRANEQRARADKHRVLIVGLFPVHAGAISAEFHDVFDLEFISPDEPHRLRALCANADHILVLTGHIGHRVSELIKSAGAHDKVVPCNGSLSSVRDRLIEIYAAI